MSEVGPRSVAGEKSGRIESGRALNGDVEIAWERWGSGSGDPLLLVNGLSSPMVAWEEGLVAMLVADGWDVVRFDNRDSGRSSRCSADTYNLGDMAGDALAVVDAVGWGTAVVFGQSMGGMIAQTMAIDHPERLAGVVSLMSNTGNPDAGGPDPEVVEAMMSTPPEDRDGWIAHRLETERYWESRPIADPEWARRKAERLYDYAMTAEGSDRQWWAVIRSGNREAALAEVKLPFLVIHGALDRLLPPEGAAGPPRWCPGPATSRSRGWATTWRRTTGLGSCLS